MRSTHSSSRIGHRPSDPRGSRSSCSAGGAGDAATATGSSTGRSRRWWRSTRRRRACGACSSTCRRTASGIPFIVEASGTVAVGETLSLRMALPGRDPMTIEPRLLVVEPGARAALERAAAVPGLFDGEHAFVLTPLDGGRTRVDHWERFGGLLLPIARGMVYEAPCRRSTRSTPRWPSAPRSISPDVTKIDRQDAKIAKRRRTALPVVRSARGPLPIGSAARVGCSCLLELLRNRDAEIATDFSSEVVADLGVPRHGASLAQRWVVPPRMPSTFTKERTSMRRQVSQQIAALHTAISSSSNPLPAALLASALFRSIASASVTLRVSMSSSRVHSWQLTPGTSSIQPIHHSASFLTTAVYFWAIGSSSLDR